MGISHSKAYAAAGVDIEAGYQGVKMMNRYVQRTLTADVISDLGGFGGLFSLDLHGLEKPVLVSGTDGVGTKQRIAQLMDRHNTVGIDCVAMCVNDIICCGAKPLFFLDYIAIGKNIPETVVYDLAGFAVGVVDRDKILDKDKMQPGDVVIALPSSGLHSNGYSLVRKVFDVENADLGQYYGELGCELGEELLRPTKIYVRPVLAAVEAADVRGISHITGGGFYENIPRCIPDGLCAKIEKKALHIPPIFPLLARMGGISERDMFNTFNMGTGMVLVAARDSADKALAALHSLGQEAGVIGEIVSGEEKVALC